MERFDHLYFKHEKTHLKKCSGDLFKMEQFNLFEISLFGVLHCVDYSTFISSLWEAQSRKIFTKNCFSPFLFTVAMETLISIKRASSKLLTMSKICYEIQIH